MTELEDHAALIARTERLARLDEEKAEEKYQRDLAQLTLMDTKYENFKQDPNGIVVTPQQRLYMQFNAQYTVIEPPPEE